MNTNHSSSVHLLRRLSVVLVAALGLLVAASTALAATKQHAQERRACPEAALIHCQAHIVIDADGKPLQFRKPSQNEVQPLAAVGATAYGPSAIHTGYGLPWYSTVRQTIALVVAFHHPYLKYDLDKYNAAYGLGSFPACSSTVVTSCFTQVNANGYASGYPATAPSDSLWDLEADMDVETAHMVCLNCKILVVEFDNSFAGAATAENTAARLGATEISNSYSISESKVDGTTWSYRSAWNHAGIAITASAGDGNVGAQFPADLNTVVAVGGTELNLNSDGSYKSESVWGLSASGGTGSGCSGFADAYTSAAWWQNSVANWSSTLCGKQRGIADVAADASCDSATWVFTTKTITQASSWELGCGTSLAAPLIAGVYALAGNAASVTWAAQIPYQHTAYLHDVTTGSNGYCGTIMCNATRGYDGPTGVGTPFGLGGF